MALFTFGKGPILSFNSGKVPVLINKSRICIGVNTLFVLSLYQDWITAAAPATKALADDVPLKLAV